ncbi:hypothetical protein EMCRGX_G010950 [Ephydatia muelleri]
MTLCRTKVWLQQTKEWTGGSYSRRRSRDGVTNNSSTNGGPLSQKSVGRHNRKPKVHAQKVDNVSKALDFIMREERIKLVNIGSEDIVTPNLKLILGLVWTLILHYQISQGFGFDIDDPADGSRRRSLGGASTARLCKENVAQQNDQQPHYGLE